MIHTTIVTPTYVKTLYEYQLQLHEDIMVTFEVLTQIVALALIAPILIASSNNYMTQNVAMLQEDL